MREVTIEDMEELTRASDVGIFELLPAEQAEQAMTKTQVSMVRILGRVRSMPDFRVGNFIVLEIIDAPRIYGVCRECGCGDKRACPPPNFDSPPGIARIGIARLLLGRAGFVQRVRATSPSQFETRGLQAIADRCAQRR
jgi:hypothetical protein